MIQKGSFLQVIDNSGAKEVCCIQVVKGYRRRYGYVGNLLVVSIKSLRKQRRLSSKIKKGDIVNALIVRTLNPLKTYSNESLCFFENAVVLLTKSKVLKFLGSRIFGSVPKLFRFTKFLKIVSMCTGYNL